MSHVIRAEFNLAHCSNYVRHYEPRKVLIADPDIATAQRFDALEVDDVCGALNFVYGSYGRFSVEEAPALAPLPDLAASA